LSEATIALALLKTNWDLKQASYIDNFNALTAECLRQSRVDVVSAPEVRDALARLFRLRIPLNTVDSLLVRAKKQGLVTQAHGVFRINRPALVNLHFADERERVARMHDHLVADLSKYVAERFQLKWAPDDVERALHGYLAENALALFRSTATRTLLQLPKRPSKSERYMFGSYVRRSHGGSLDRAHQQRGAASLHAEAGCLTIVDAARIMKKRRTQPAAHDASSVLRLSRRRCCVCFGLHRDAGVKKGQIAHLDQDRDNNSVDNLAWLCLEHHDEYDSTTSQSKSLQLTEVKRYRDELYDEYSQWDTDGSSAHLLRFLAATMSVDDMLDGAIKVASRYRICPEDLVEEALSDSDYESMDAMRWVPHITLLEDMQQWGWLTFDLREDEEGVVRVRVDHGAVCHALLLRLKERRGDGPHHGG
jgi:hypothetical protein